MNGQPIIAFNTAVAMLKVIKMCTVLQAAAGLPSALGPIDLFIGIACKAGA